MKSLITAILMCIVSLSHAEEGLIKASGFGAVDLSKVKIEQQAKLMATRAAQLDAQRNLLEQVKGLRLSGGTTMEDFEISSDVVATRVKDALKGAFQMSENVSKAEGSMMVEVVMAICVNSFHEECKDRPTLEGVDLDTSVGTY